MTTALILSFAVFFLCSVIMFVKTYHVSKEGEIEVETSFDAVVFTCWVLSLIALNVLILLVLFGWEWTTILVGSLAVLLLIDHK